MRLLLSLFPVLILAHFYIGRKLYIALVTLFGLAQSNIFPYLGLALIAVTLYPLVLLVVWTMDDVRANKMLAGKPKALDLLSGPFWFGVILVVELTPWLFVLDFLKIPFYPFYEKFTTLWFHFQHRIEFAMIGAFAVYVLSRLCVDTIWIGINRKIAIFPKLSVKIDGFRIAQISDTKLGNRSGLRRLKRYVKKMNRLNPDIVFFTGDLVSGERALLLKAAQAMGEIKTRFGVFACLGDQDHEIGSKLVKSELRSQHITVLEDSNQFIRIGRESILVTFISNHKSKRANLDTTSYLMGKQPRGAIDIAIAHQPSETMIELAAESGYHIFLAGHTHGGQIVVRVLGFSLTPAQMSTPFYKGIRFVQKMLVSVNNGLGFTLAPFRFRAQAQITLITLRRGSSK